MRLIERHAAIDIDPGAWDGLLAEFPNATVFHTMPWLQTVQQSHGGRLALTGVYRGDTLQAVWPCMEVRKGPLRVLGSPLPGWSTAYMGPLFRSGCNVNSALQAFFEHKRLRKPAYFACKVMANGPRVDLTSFGFDQVLQFDTYCVDLTQSDEGLWNNLKSECRTQIRKAHKLGITIQEETTPDFIEEYWTMSVETFANTNIRPTFPKPFVDALWSNVRPSGRLRVLSAWHAGERVAMLVLPFDGHTMYYWGGASYLRHRKLPAHNLLHWEAMKLAKSFGLQRYDFVSTMGGAGRFKSTFGPQAVTMSTHWERSQSRFIAALKRGYESYLMRRQRIVPEVARLVLLHAPIAHLEVF